MAARPCAVRLQLSFGGSIMATSDTAEVPSENARMKFRIAPPLLILACFALIGGCTYVNVPLNSIDAPVDHRAVNHTRAALLRTSDASEAPTAPFVGDGWFVGLAISGGGSRSANFSAA